MSELNDSSQKTWTDDEILAGLKKWFHHDSFRKGQAVAIREVLDGKDVVVIMPTGSGKSLCYQLPATLLPGTTLVISPLIALMKDQVDALDVLGIPATFLNSSVSLDEMASRLACMAAGRYKLVYVAPERFRNHHFREALSQTKVSLLTIDEAHCISQWGHDFRPDYLNLRQAASMLPGVPIMAVTATATPDVRRDIIKQLGLGEAPRSKPAIHVHGFARDNLTISVCRCATHDEKLAHIMALIRKHGTGIVYVATRKQAERVYKLVRDELGIGLFASGAGMPDVILYHGAMSDEERDAAHGRFVSAPSPVVIATNAFGMGVDRADIRFVAHWDVPGSVEAYYQEIGRAGRDGKPSFCELLFNYADVRTQRFFIEGANPTRYDADRLLETIRSATASGPRVASVEEWAEMAGVKNPMAARTIIGILERARLIRREPVPGQRSYATQAVASADTTALDEQFEARKEKGERDNARLDAMLQLVDCRTCRHKFILEDFGEDSTDAVCPGCDNCGHGSAGAPLTETQWIMVQKILSCVIRMRGRFGPRRIMQVLTGDSDPILEEKGLDRLSTYGILSNMPSRQIYALLDELARAGCIDISADQYHLMSITPKGVRVAKRQFHGFTLNWPSLKGASSSSTGRKRSGGGYWKGRGNSRFRRG